jgi:hypothetical protein
VNTHIFIIPVAEAEQALQAMRQSVPFSNYAAKLSVNGNEPATHFIATRVLSSAALERTNVLKSSFQNVVILEWDTDTQPSKFSETLSSLGLQRVNP